MFTNLPSVEMLAYQGPSPLFKELTKIIQDIFDVMPTMTKDTLLKDRLNQYNKVAKQQTTMAKIEQAVLRNINLKLKVEINNDYHTFCILTKIAKLDDPSFIVATLRSTGQINTDNAKLLPNKGKLSLFVEKTLEQIKNSVDETAGTFSDLFGKTYACTLFFSMKNVAENDFWEDPFTAEEIAAIILHELGHIYNFSKELSWIYYCTELSQVCVDYIEKVLERKDCIVLIENCLDLTKSIQNDEVETLKKSLTAMRKKLVSDQPFDQSDILSVQFLSKLTTALVFSQNTKKIVFKEGDQLTTLNNSSHNERVTDRFATMHGAGGPLATGLIKIMKTGELGHMFDDLTNIPLFLLKFARVTVWMLHIFVLPNVTIDSGYDPIEKRVDHVVKDLYAILKSNHLTPEVRNACLSAISDAVKANQNYSEQIYVRHREAFYKFISGISKHLGLAFLPFVKDTAREYQFLQDVTDQFLRNPLHYQKHRIGQIIDQTNAS